MQFFEFLFLVLLATLIARLVVGSAHPLLSYATLGAIGLTLILLGIIVEGWRWQMIPAYVGFGAIMLASLKRSKTRVFWRVFGSVPAILLLGASSFLAHQLPVQELPAPAGPYGVGIFEYSITEHSRVERYAPHRKRELYVEVWYPANRSGLDEYPARTLYQELYEGRYDKWSFFLGYLKHVPTHSYVEAPIVNGGPFPVLLFNHGGRSFTSQSQLLMEHLASHGYVIFSIAHPYESLKVNLADGRTIGLAPGQPSDIDFQLAEMDLSLMRRIIEVASGRAEISRMRAVLHRLADSYAGIEDKAGKDAFLAKAATMAELQPYKEFVTQDRLGDYLLYTRSYQARAIEYWVEDIQFIATTIADLQAPVENFAENLDTSGFGVFGMSYGGAAAGEFCKVDERCKAGANLDGTQFGPHWNQKVAAPFLMLYNEEHQPGNDYAYLPPTHDFWDYAVKGSTHIDFIDGAYIAPLAKTLGLAGSIDALKMVDIVNTVQLGFFDHYLKGKPLPSKAFSDIPELIPREH